MKDELIKVNIAESASGGIITGKQYDYGRQSVSLLRYGLDPANYRIVYDGEDDVYLVVYRHTAHALWQVVSREKTYGEATQAQKEMIRQLKQISTASEGCYLLEHLLLKPAYADKAFGFRICDRGNKLLLQHAQWLTLDEREARLNNIASLVAALNEKDAYGSWQQLQQQYNIYFYPGDTPELLTAAHFTAPSSKAAVEKTMLDLLLLIRQMKEGQPRQVHVVKYVKHGASQMLQEEFFRFGMSIVLPSWPARFQHQEFRSFTEAVFREHTPVQFRMYFRWIGIAAMQEFELRYFNWLKAMRGEADKPSAANALMELIIRDPLFSHYVVTV